MSIPDKVKTDVLELGPEREIKIRTTIRTQFQVSGTRTDFGYPTPFRVSSGVFNCGTRILLFGRFSKSISIRSKNGFQVLRESETPILSIDMLAEATQTVQILRTSNLIKISAIKIFHCCSFIYLQ